MHSRIFHRTFMTATMAIALFAGGRTSPATAQEQTFNLTIHDTRFEPSTLSVPSGVKFKLQVRNARAKPAEFESAELNREKVVAPGSSVVIYIGPLSPGTYGFFDDFNPSTRGQLVAK